MLTDTYSVDHWLLQQMYPARFEHMFKGFQMIALVANHDYFHGSVVSFQSHAPIPEEFIIRDILAPGDVEFHALRSYKRIWDNICKKSR